MLKITAYKKLNTHVFDELKFFINGHKNIMLFVTINDISINTSTDELRKIINFKISLQTIHEANTIVVQTKIANQWYLYKNREGLTGNISDQVLMQMIDDKLKKCNPSLEDYNALNNYFLKRNLFWTPKININQVKENWIIQ